MREDSPSQKRQCGNRSLRLRKDECRQQTGFLLFQCPFWALSPQDGTTHLFSQKQLYRHAYPKALQSDSKSSQVAMNMCVYLQISNCIFVLTQTHTSYLLVYIYMCVYVYTYKYILILISIYTKIVFLFPFCIFNTASWKLFHVNF